MVVNARMFIMLRKLEVHKADDNIRPEEDERTQQSQNEEDKKE